MGVEGTGQEWGGVGTGMGWVRDGKGVELGMGKTGAQWGIGEGPRKRQTGVKASNPEAQQHGSISKSTILPKKGCKHNN